MGTPLFFRPRRMGCFILIPIIAYSAWFRFFRFQDSKPEPEPNFNHEALIGSERVGFNRVVGSRLFCATLVNIFIDFHFVKFDFDFCLIWLLSHTKIDVNWLDNFKNIINIYILKIFLFLKHYFLFVYHLYIFNISSNFILEGHFNHFTCGLMAK